jgi:hypothetical protein
MTGMASHDSTSPPAVAGENEPDVHRETSDVNFRAILTFGIGLTVAAALIHVLLWLLFMYFQNREARAGVRQFPLTAEQQNRLPPEPRLQTNPRRDLGELRAGEETILNTYGWVDRTTGVVHIPIDEAMRLTIERGLPTRPPGQR